MKYTKKQRKEIIQRLVDNDGDTILCDGGAVLYLESILRDGFIGYANMTDNQLRAELQANDWIEDYE